MFLTVAHNSSLTHKGAIQVNSSTADESFVKELENVRRREMRKRRVRQSELSFGRKRLHSLVSFAIFLSASVASITESIYR